MGRVIHVMILEPENFDDIFQVVDVASKNTKAFKEAQLDNPKTCITRKDKEAGERMADAFNRNELALSYLSGSETEVPMIDMIGGFPFRGKADIQRGGEIIDLKTTTDLKAFSIVLISMDMIFNAISIAIYSRPHIRTSHL